jgi:hypothetical protein
MALSTIEAARASAVLEDAIDKLSFLASIGAHNLQRAGESAELLGPDITRVIEHQVGRGGVYRIPYMLQDQTVH